MESYGECRTEKSMAITRHNDARKRRPREGVDGAGAPTFVDGTRFTGVKPRSPGDPAP